MKPLKERRDMRLAALSIIRICIGKNRILKSSGKELNYGGFKVKKTS
ncbi:hypothetical protein HY993_01020 [Candidatus Micrarchaeota archaeon]|nr:hypothetical protein [Candidatus Micrarchaeota archaeon]